MTGLYEASGLALPGRLRPTDLHLRAGEIAILVGPNGAGKTSLLRAAAGIEAGSGGIQIEGHDIALMSTARRSAALAFLPTAREVAWPLLARDYVALGLVGSVSEEAIDEALAVASVQPFAARRIDRLSTGERSRVMLARALVARPKVLLLDEPCSNLDPYWQVALTERLRERAGDGAAILMSVHDLDLALSRADRLIVMDEGRIVADGPPAEAGEPDRIAEIFGVRAATRGWQRA